VFLSLMGAVYGVPPPGVLLVVFFSHVERVKWGTAPMRLEEGKDGDGKMRRARMKRRDSTDAAEEGVGGTDALISSKGH